MRLDMHPDQSAPKQRPAGPDDLRRHGSQHDDIPRQHDSRSRRRAIRHDIQHQVGTIMLLAGLLLDAETDTDNPSQQRLGQIIGEVRWLDELLRAYDTAELPTAVPDLPYGEVIWLDAVAGEIVASLKLATMCRLTFSGAEATAYVDRLGLWRAVRNLADNAVRAAGAHGRVHIGVLDEGEYAVVQVDDDGPGFGAGPPGLASLGLRIVRDFAAAYGGELQVAASEMGGGRVRLLLPAETGTGQ